FNQQKRSSLSQSDSQSLQIKEEQEDLSDGQKHQFKTPFTAFEAEKQEYKCETCGKAFQFRSRLLRHMIIHTGVKPFSCHVCGKRFNQKSILIVHQRIHTGERPYPCDVCGKRFNQKSILNDGQTHQFKTPFTAFEPEKQEYKCETCGKVFQFRSRLLRHMIIHTGVKPFSCHVCGKRFNQKSILIVHQRIHTGERPYSCDVCGKRFNQKSILNVHKRIHTGERPYCCETCGKTFTQKSILNGHKIIHTNDPEKKPVPSTFSCLHLTSADICLPSVSYFVFSDDPENHDGCFCA
uniref:C2H2-type domain-containing protein n=1 Tax=Oryzias melastigma TaxID=30732 RepID=A0A3B3C4X7_ORYME